MDTIPNSQTCANNPNPLVHTLSMGLATIHPEAFSSMAFRGHRVSAVVGQTLTKFKVETECTNNEAYGRRHHCRGTGTMQFVLGDIGPMLFLAELKHDKACVYSTATLEDLPCKDEQFRTKYCDYMSEAVTFSAANLKAKRNAREEAEARHEALPDTDITLLNAGTLNQQIIALYDQFANCYSVPRPKSFWKS